MADFALKEGDLVPSITATLEDSDGTPIDITGADVTFVMRAIRGDAPIIEAVATNLQAGAGTTGQVRYDWQVGDTDTPGGYDAEWRVEFAEGFGTIPSNRYIAVEILPKLGGGS